MLHKRCFSNVIATTRLIKQFDDESILKFKKCLLNRLNCANEQDFLCTVLNKLYTSLPNDVLSTIKSDAIRIAQSQLPAAAISTTKSMSLYDSIMNKYDDNICSLSSNTIDAVGSFLTKTESIAFGFLNKQLY